MSDRITDHVGNAVVRLTLFVFRVRGSAVWSFSWSFVPATIDGVIWRPLKKFHDPRGWLCELFRHDELPAEFHPVMAYISMTEPGVARGPHEHIDQSDCFCFLGPSNFKVYLWDDRKDSASQRHLPDATSSASTSRCC